MPLPPAGPNDRMRDDFSHNSIARAVDRRRPGSRACLASGLGDPGFCCRVDGVCNARLQPGRALNRPGFEPRCDRDQTAIGTRGTHSIAGNESKPPCRSSGSLRLSAGTSPRSKAGSRSMKHSPVVAAAPGQTGLGLFLLILPGSLALEARAVSSSEGGPSAHVCAFESAEGIDGRPQQRTLGRADSHARHRRLASW